MKNKNTLLNVVRKYLTALFLVVAPALLHAQYDTAYPPPQEKIDEPAEKKVEVKVADAETLDYYDEEEGNFISKTLYDGLQYKDRKMPVVDVRKLQDEDDFWYANAEIKRERGNVVTYVPRRTGKGTYPGKSENVQPQNGNQPVENNNGSAQTETYEYKPPRKKMSSEPWFQALLWIVIIGGFVGALVWYLMGNNVGMFRKNKKAIETGTETGEEEMPEDIFAIQYQKEIDKAAANGDFRLAIRLMYLRLLKNLAERNIIRYQQDKTNFDYLMQVHSTPIFTDFSRATRHYEYTWYGNFPVSSETYTVIKSTFDNFPQ